MLTQIALMPILGYPAIMYGGIMTLLLLIVQLIMGSRINRGKCKLSNPMKWHKFLAWVVVLLGLGHGLLGLGIILGL